jgi:hypothetical protein
VTHALREGLTPLDEERAESMASEGGRSAQAIEGGTTHHRRASRLRGDQPWWIALSLGVLGAFLAYRGVRQRL